MNTKKNYTPIESKIVLFGHNDVITASAPETPILGDGSKKFSAIDKQTNDVYNED